jgi:phage-related minor tail protein
MTENTREVQLKSSFDATGVRTGVEQAKTAIQDLGKTAEREGAKAGAGLAKAGEGLQKSAADAERAVGRYEAQLRRLTAETQAAADGTGKAGAVLNKAIADGVDVTRLEPSLAKLRQAEAAATAAAQRSLSSVGVSAAQTAAALRQVPAQFTDIITSISAGQSPITVLLQQGGQLKDAFGGAGAAARALGGYVLGLINPFTVAAVAVGALALAYERGDAESREFQRTLILTGNAAGTTADRLSQVSAEIAKGGITRGGAAEALNQLAATGKVGAENLGRFAAAAIELQRAGGPAIDDTAKAFAELGRAPLQAALKLNESTNFLTAALYEQIKALEEQGRSTEAARVAQQGFSAAMEQRIPQLAANLGLLERAWRGIKDAIAGAADELLNVGRKSNISELQNQLKNAEIAAKEAGPAGLVAILAERKVRALRDQVDAAQEVERLARRSAEADAARLRQVTAIGEFDKLAEQSLDKQVKLKQEIARIENLGRDAGKSRAEIEAQIAAARDRFKDDAAAELASQRSRLLAADAYLTKLKEIRETGRFEQLDDARQTEGQKRVIELQEQLKGSIGEVTRARLQDQLAVAQQQAAREVAIRDLERQIGGQKRAAAEYDNLVEAAGKSADAILQQAKQQEVANAMLGNAKIAVAELTLAELQHQQAELENTAQTTPAYLAALQAKIDAQQRFVAALKAADFKALNDGLAEWMRSASEQDQLFREEQRLVGLSRLEREKIVAARQVELKLAKELAEIDRASIDDDKKDELRTKARAAAQKEASAAVNKVMRDDIARTSDEIQRSLTDALLRGFESGKGFAQNLRDTVENMFKTLVLRPVLQPIMGSVANTLAKWLGGGSSGGGVGGLGGLSTLVGGLGSMLNSSWLSAFGTGMGLTGSQAATASAAYAQAGMAGTGSALSLGSSAASFGPYAALIAMAMGAADKAFTQGFSARNLPYTQAWLMTGGIAPPSLKFDTNLLTKLGVNEKLANVITGASLWSKAFGRSAPQVQGQGVTGTASLGGFSGQVFTDWLQKGGWFRSDKSGTDFSPVTAEQDATLDAGIKALFSATADYAKVLGLPVEAVKGYSASFKVAWGKTEEENQKAIQAAFVNLGDQLAARYATQLAPLQKAGETLSATLQRLSTLQVFSNSLNDLGGIFSRVAGSTVDAREQLIALAGGMDSLSQQATGFAQNYFSRDEIAGLKAREVQNALGTAGVSTDINTRDQFRALVESLDPSSSTGREQLAALLNLQGSFATVADYLAETGLTLGQVAQQAPASDALVSPLLSGVGQQVQLAQQAVDVQYETRDATLQVVSAVQQLTQAIGALGGSVAVPLVPSYRQPEVGLAP